ncbi:helix-turn-helix transcriptional regulator [Streptomyces viridosporus]|uniref:helix-turn-helix transcriptional regulator n=1 Tax=Streptomyces viridosporus TaxID=67581 RepID=UPI0036FF4F78
MNKTAVPVEVIAGDPQWHTTADVAKRYRTAPGTVRYWRHIGYGPKGVKVGRRVLYSGAELDRFDAWLAQQATSAETA